MRGLQRLASAARGTLWLLRATGLREHFSKFESHLNDLDAKVLHVASQSATAVRVADNVQRLEKQISDVMADVTSQHTTTVRVAESVQRLGKHIVDVAANNLTNGRLSEQFQKLEKHLSENGTSHLLNGRLTEQFQKLERHINEVAANSLNGKLTEPFRRLEKQMTELAASNLAIQSELGECFRRLAKQLEAAAPLGQLTERLQALEQRLEQATAGFAQQEDRTRWLQAQDLRLSAKPQAANSVPNPLFPERESVTYVSEVCEWFPFEFTIWEGRHHESFLGHARRAGAGGDG
jgi:septal ring factor EnvC (AmiA/AmiB activator)